MKVEGGVQSEDLRWASMVCKDTRMISRCRSVSGKCCRCQEITRSEHGKFIKGEYSSDASKPIKRFHWRVEAGVRRGKTFLLRES